MIRVVLADDHAMLRDGLAALISEEPGMSVVGQADDTDSAVAVCLEAQPDIAIIDLDMPGGGGLAVVERLADLAPGIRTLVLTMHDDPSFLRRAVAAGCSGFLLKRSAGEELLTALREICAGRAYLRGPIEGLRSVVEPPTTPPAKDAVQKLSQRENEVLELLAYGYTNKEIATKLRLAKQTVDTYRQRIQEKLDLSGRSEIVHYALSIGLLKADKR